MANPNQAALPQAAPSTVIQAYLPPGTVTVNRLTALAFIHRRFKVPEDVLRSYKKRKVRHERKHAAKYDSSKPTLETLGADVIHIIAGMLDNPSRISLALTSKYFAESMKDFNTSINDLPTYVRMHMNCRHLPCYYTNHLSTRRILLLMLKSWMPHGMTLCWICLKYTKTSASKWLSTSLVNLQGLNRIRIPALDALNIKKVKCHAECLPPHMAKLFDWVYNRPGASGGFNIHTFKPGTRRFWPVTYDSDRLITYDAGMNQV